MAIYKMEVSWGEALLLAVRRYCDSTGIRPTVLFEAVGELTGDSRPTISKLLEEPLVPRRLKDRNRATVLVLAIGEEPVAWELEDADLLPAIRALGRRKIRSIVRGKWAARDSNPEPAGSDNGPGQGLAPFAAAAA
jgi:hypothetical protein